LSVRGHVLKEERKIFNERPGGILGSRDDEDGAVRLFLEAE
jgi:hypothetical protein